MTGQQHMTSGAKTTLSDIMFFFLQDILTVEERKMRAVADCWVRMKKKRTLDSWDLTYLECKIFSWSLEDVLNKDLLKEKVRISHPLPRQAILLYLQIIFVITK